MIFRCPFQPDTQSEFSKKFNEMLVVGFQKAVPPVLIDSDGKNH